MEVCTPRSLSTLPYARHLKPSSFLLRSISFFSSNKNPTFLTRSGLIYSAVRLPRATTSEETSTIISEQSEEAPDQEITSNETQSEKVHDEAITDEDAPIPSEVVPMDAPIEEFFNGLMMKLGSEDTYSILVYGTGTLVTLWILSVIIGAIDSIPLFPDLLEVTGLFFTIWFSYRYLIFKKNRDELLTKIEELKQQIIGPIDE
ncbi:uncharacterized protein LOC143889520 [Tasmannia lanceolata]|uniref:uncharacterized protein LOC143889520 n=1 Tax=Tasmannia lanceolata TaxID=3420 RepID=UPI00406393DC